MNGKIILIGFLIIASVSLILFVGRTFEFATTAQQNEFKCTCELPSGEKAAFLLDIDTSDKFTPEPLRQTVFYVEINNSSVPCSCSK